MLAMDITDNKLPNDYEELAYNLLDYIGINRSKANRFVSELSGGERQRVAIARSLGTNVDLILADEPTGNLDVEIEEEIISILKKLAHEHQKCIIVVTHSKEVAMQSDKVLYLRNGELEIIRE